MAEMSRSEAPADGLTQANNAPREKGKPVYEIGFHVVPTVEEAQLGGEVEHIRALLGDAEIISEAFPQKIKLAYVIERATTGKREKYAEAYFGWVKCATDKENINAIEEGLCGMKNILRYLLVETVREDVSQAPRRAVFTSDRLEGEVISKPAAPAEERAEVSDAELDKSIDALVN